MPPQQVLYLHGNQISHMGDVARLAKLPNLTKLTLHGNPISEQVAGVGGIQWV